ncbi:MAG: DUF1569 domain-containing protein [Planctomycetia bacterium]|nr:DUF1569 domain-containing protein [Planctomycetia bacterium]
MSDHTAKINTAKVAGRRTLRFASTDEVLAEVERLVAAPQVQRLGNWTLAQAISHLARSLDISVDGAKFRVAWYIRLVGPLLKKRILTQPMPAGFKLTGGAKTALVAEPELSSTAALADLRRATARLKKESHREPHAIFGRFTREEWDTFHCRHAEMHLSFFVIP